LLATIAWNRYADSQWKFAWFVTVIGLLYSAYLTGISLFVLEATCPYCLTSLGLMTAIFVTLLLQKPSNLPRFSWGPWLGKSVGTAAVIVALLHLHYAGYIGKAPGPEDPWIRGLAEHLSRTDAKFYGASWCPHCIEQKELFGSSGRRLPYIECSAGGAGKQTAVCNEAGVKNYPTWVIDGQRYTGTQSLDALAQYSKYKGAGDNKP
jgi:glutaredoxin